MLFFNFKNIFLKIYIIIQKTFYSIPVGVFYFISYLKPFIYGNIFISTYLLLFIFMLKLSIIDSI